MAFEYRTCTCRPSLLAGSHGYENHFASWNCEEMRAHQLHSGHKPDSYTPISDTITSYRPQVDQFKPLVFVSQPPSNGPCWRARRGQGYNDNKWVITVEIGLLSDPKILHFSPAEPAIADLMKISDCNRCVSWNSLERGHKPCSNVEGDATLYRNCCNH